jgi:hypothetical protein
MVGLMAVRTAPFVAGLLVLCTGCLLIFVLGMETVRVIVFVSGLLLQSGFAFFKKLNGV